jgi:hypothetical protein
VTPDRDAAPTALFFSALQRTQPRTIRVAQYRRDALPTLIGGAAAIVFVRGLFEFADVVACAERLGIPRYYFLDDHFILVREQGGAAAVFAREHSEGNVARVLRGFEGVLISTGPLLRDFEQRRLHAHLMLFPPTAIAPIATAPTRSSVQIAFFGGSHLHDVFLRAIVPAVRRLALTRAVTLIAAGLGEPIPESQGLTVVMHPYEPSYREGLARLARAGVDILVHPVAAGLLGNPFKNPHALITANALGAIPVVSNADPYTSVAGAGVAVLCDDSEASWHQGLVDAVDASNAASLRQRLADYCQTQYDGSVNADVWHTILDASRTPSALQAAIRSGVAALWLSASWIRRGVSRVRAGRFAAGTA